MLLRRIEYQACVSQFPSRVTVPGKLCSKYRKVDVMSTWSSLLARHFEIIIEMFFLKESEGKKKDWESVR